MRDLVIFVADLTMERAIESFLKRPDFAAPHNLNIKPFVFEPSEDLIRIPGNDPGVFGKGHQWLAMYRGKHKYAVVIFDREFGTQLDANALRASLTERILQIGWDDDNFRVIVIDPELEAWIWLDVITPAGRVAKFIEYVGGI
jgi:hypothetical protein